MDRSGPVCTHVESAPTQKYDGLTNSSCSVSGKAGTRLATSARTELETLCGASSDLPSGSSWSGDLKRQLCKYKI